MITRLLFLTLNLMLALALAGGPVAGQEASAPLLADRLGITFISSADHPADEERYRQALLLGAGWNRWPLYWQWVERSAGEFDWSAYDQVVTNDTRHGLRINAILLGIPDAHRDGTSIRGLGNPVFSDGTDTPGPGKTVNPDNPWARFVFNAVERYKPGGAFGSGIAVWEVWNEPDLPLFWNGSVADYARLLKVAYLAAHHADPAAEVMFGGLAYINPESHDWLAATLAIIARDPQREANNWYIDKVAVHNYSNAWRSGWVVRRAQDVLRRYGLTRPVWLNESGVPVWDDYPGPTWAANQPEQRRWRGTLQQQAAFVVQSTAYAFASGAEVVFFHQLYDDCGNQQAGTDFPPSNGEMCASGACWGDAHGLFRNTSTAICFRQSPLPGTARPAAAAFRLMAQIFGAAPFDNGTVLDLDDQGVVIAFDRVTTNERIYVLWNDSPQRINLEVPASGDGALLYSMSSEDYRIAPEDSRYTIGLPGVPVDAAAQAAGEDVGIGGAPYVLVEHLPDGLTPLNPALVVLEPFSAEDGPSSGASFSLPVGRQVFPTPGPIIGGPATGGPTPVPLPTQPPAPTITPLARPTVDPAHDTEAPVPTMIPLPLISPPTFTVFWGGYDDSGIASYVVWVRVNDGEWEPWLEETTATQATFEGEAGNRYEFAVWAKDLAGNWSLNTELRAQAQTAVQ